VRLCAKEIILILLEISHQTSRDLIPLPPQTPIAHIDPVNPAIFIMCSIADCRRRYTWQCVAGAFPRVSPLSL
jgi:hypothetical protein